MSTKFPSSTVLMEPAAYMKNRGLRAIVEWAPRVLNRESDRLANGVTDGFHSRIEMKVDPNLPIDEEKVCFASRGSRKRFGIVDPL